MPGLFITGTDTDCGKTLVTLAVMQALQQQGLTVNGMKPVAAGVERIDCQRLNPDAWQIRQQASILLDYASVNPCLFELPVSPHLAASNENRRVDTRLIQQHYKAIAAVSDWVIVEGAGGWRVPLSDTLDVADLPGLLCLPVVLVVGIRLGCLNHARLTLEAILRDDVPVAGWVGTVLDPEMTCLDGNIDSLKQLLEIPCLGILPYDEAPSSKKMADGLSIESLTVG